MQLQQFLFCATSFLTWNEVKSPAFNENYDSQKIEICSVLDHPCEIDACYDSLVQLKTDNVLLYKELNTASGGNNAIIVWKDKNCVFGLKFREDVIKGCQKEAISPDNSKLGLIALKFFYGGEKNYSVTKSKIEVMHDFKIEIRALINGKEMRSDFFDSAVSNKSEFLPEIGRLCQDIIYNW